MVKIKLSGLLGKAKWTQKRLADETGIRPATISKMYYGETKRIEIDQIDRICAALGCEIHELFEYVDTTKKPK